MKGSDLALEFHKVFAHLQMDLLKKHGFKNGRMLAGPGTLLFPQSLMKTTSFF